jgi:superfamily II DNA/RNA helicase
LDIGHVDLIISYDVLSSQLRIVQRFGRTGRKRAGRCVTLMIKGAEEEKYDKVQADKTRRMRELKSAGKKPSWLRRGQVARMLPPAITPTIEYKDIRPIVPSSVKASRKRARAASVVAEAAAAATGDSSAAGEQDASAIDDAAANNDDDDGVAVEQDGLYAGLPAHATGGDEGAGELDQQMESLLNGMEDAEFAAAADSPFDSTLAQDAVPSSTSSAASVPPAALPACAVPAQPVRQPLSKRLDAVAQTLKGKAAVAATAAPAQSVQSMFGRLQAQQQQQVMERKLAREAKKGAGAPRMEYAFVRSQASPARAPLLSPFQCCSLRVSCLLLCPFLQEQLFIMKEDEAHETLLGYKPTNTVSYGATEDGAWGTGIATWHALISSLL